MSTSVDPRDSRPFYGKGIDLRMRSHGLKPLTPTRAPGASGAADQRARARVEHESGSSGTGDLLEYSVAAVMTMLGPFPIAIGDAL
jgi:hypothetical protein